MTAVGIVGATGAVGQNYALLLENHPWFYVNYVAASPASAGKTYAEAVKDKWFMDKDIPQGMRHLKVGNANNIEDAIGKCEVIFSSYEGDKAQIQETELAYAKAGFPVISNNSAHRWTPDVPMIIPEINPGHTKIIASQKKARGFEKGFIVTKPNCSIQSFMAPVYALMAAGYAPGRIMVTTEQASSGAGYPGVPSLDLIGNVVPYISGEEEKTEAEPLKIFGEIKDGRIENYQSGLAISANCTRVPVKDGHMAFVNLEFADRSKAPALEEIIRIWKEFKGLPQINTLPSAPDPAIIYRDELNRPQPRKDADAGNGMAVTVGRLRKCSIFDIKFAGCSHNTNRGAAGGAILTAELLDLKGYFDAPLEFNSQG
jgi:aspartate-semialdehyde dehydrogenase